MGLRLERPLAFIDLETTGVDVARDRIVQIAAIRLEPSGTRTPYDTLIDPGVPIPPESSAVHGITDEKVKGAPKFWQAAGRLDDLLGGADIGGFGVSRFDVPMLAAEYQRAGLEFRLEGRRVLDALTIFHRMEPRNLSAAYEFYCGKPLEGAHDARADVAASLEVLLAQVERYREAKGSRAALPQAPQGIHDFCAAVDPRFVDPRGRFVWRHGAATFNFGKHNGRTLEEIVRADRSYLEWLSRAESSSPEVAEICRKALVGSFPRRAGG